MILFNSKGLEQAGLVWRSGILGRAWLREQHQEARRHAFREAGVAQGLGTAKRAD